VTQRTKEQLDYSVDKWVTLGQIYGYTVFGMDIHASVNSRLLLLCDFEVLPANVQEI